MLGNLVVRSLKPVARFARRLRKDNEGVAAVEFGIIAPLLLVMLVGVIEITRAVSIDRRFGQVTSLVADLVARESNVTASDVNGIYGIVQHVMGVWGTQTLKLEVIPVQAHPTNATIRKVYAQGTNRPTYGGAAQKSFGADYSLPDDLLAPGASVIVVEAEYTFNPLIVNDFISSQVWKDKATLAPRESCVDFDDNNCVTNVFSGG
jgi:Flp pilus assembly protein TadG